MGYSAAAARPLVLGRAVCRTARLPARRIPSTWARTCSGEVAVATRTDTREWVPGRRGEPDSCRARGLLNELRKRGPDSIEPLSFGQLAGLWARDDHDVVLARNGLALEVKRLPEHAFDAVALDSAPDLPRHRKS